MTASSSSVASWRATLFGALTVACTGTIGDLPSTKPGSRAGQGGGTGGAGDTPPLGAPPSRFLTGPGVRRLTRIEYANTVRSLLGVEVDRTRQPKELIEAGHSQIAGAQKTGYADVEGYLALAESTAASAAPSLISSLGCSDVACLQAWAPAFLRRAFRSPPPEPILARYRGLLDSDDAGATPEARLATFLTAVLTSPYFLYRRETGTASGGGGAPRALDSHEVATRLSYLVWQTMPDADLEAAADAGTLADGSGRLVHLERMLADERAKQGMRAFVLDWMAVFENRLSQKNPVLLASTSPEFPANAERGLDLLIDDVLFGAGPGRLADLLRTDTSFADGSLAAVLGLGGGGADFERRTVPTAERRGILAHPLVIGAHSKEGGASPFPIGRFIYQNVLCSTVPPPAKIPVVDTENLTDQTLRETLEAVTANEPCQTCHSRIGPPGFAFLPFDAIGRYNASDPLGRPYDTAGELLIDGREGRLPFASASDLADKLSTEPEVLRCVARRLFRWTFGRFESVEDETDVTGVGDVSVASGTAIGDLMRALVASEAFAQVRTQE